MDDLLIQDWVGGVEGLAMRTLPEGIETPWHVGRIITASSIEQKQSFTFFMITEGRK